MDYMITYIPTISDWAWASHNTIYETVRHTYLSIPWVVTSVAMVHISFSQNGEVGWVEHECLGTFVMAWNLRSDSRSCELQHDKSFFIAWILSIECPIQNLYVVLILRWKSFMVGHPMVGHIRRINCRTNESPVTQKLVFQLRRLELSNSVIPVLLLYTVKIIVKHGNAVSIFDETYKISQDREPVAVCINMFIYLWNLADLLAVVLLAHLANFIVIEKYYLPNLRLRDFARSCDKTSLQYWNGPLWPL